MGLSVSFCLDGRAVTWMGRSGNRAPALRAVTGPEPAALMEELLKAFDDIFALPSTLWPARSRDLRIRLHPGAAPVAVRPYRYPQLQKDEIERQCTDMLRQGIIRAS